MDSKLLVKYNSSTTPEEDDMDTEKKRAVPSRIYAVLEGNLQVTLYKD